MDGVQAEARELALDFLGEEPGEEGVGFGAVFGFAEDDGALADLGVGHGGDEDVVADLFEVGGAGEGEGDESELGVAGLGELAGLSDVFGDDEVGLGFVVDAELLHGADGGAAVGGVELVGDGDGLDAGVGEGVDRERVEGRVLAGPEDECSVGVGYGIALLGESGGDDFLGEDEVGAEEDVDGSAVEDLGGEGSGGGEAEVELDAGGVLVGGGESGENRLEVGGGVDVELDRRPGLLGGAGGWSGQGRGDEHDCTAEEREHLWPGSGFTIG